jgi:hypothetical protein
VSTQPSRVGRPAGRPDGEVPEYVELALWLIEVMESDPPITRTRIAAAIETEDGRPVALSTVSSWLKGRKNTDPRLVKAVVDARSAHLGPARRILLEQRAKELTAAADIAEANLRRQIPRRPQPRQSGGAPPAGRAFALHDECRWDLRAEERRRAVAEERARIADETIEALSQQIEALVDQQNREREQVRVQSLDHERYLEQVTTLQLEVAELRARLHERGTDPSGQRVVQPDPLADLADKREALAEECRALEDKRGDLQLQVAEHERQRKSAYDEVIKLRARGQDSLAALDSQRRTAQADLESLLSHHRALLGEVEHLAIVLGEAAPASPELPLPSSDNAYAWRPEDGPGYDQGYGYAENYQYGQDYRGYGYGGGYQYGQDYEEGGYYAQPLADGSSGLFPGLAAEGTGTQVELGYANGEQRADVPRQRPGRHRRSEQ